MNNLKKKQNELKDLEVDRVDAVDRPATGRGFLLFKNKDGTFATPGVEPIVTAPVRKRAGYRFGCDMSSAVFGAAPVRKDEAPNPAVRTFDGDDAQFRDSDDAAFEAPNAAADREVERFNAAVSSWNGRPSDATRQAGWRADSWMRGDQEDPSRLANTTQFSNTRDSADHTPPEQEAPRNPNFAGRGLSSGLAAPEEFKAPVPRVQRLGSSYILRRAPDDLPLGEVIARQVPVDDGWKDHEEMEKTWKHHGGLGGAKHMKVSFGDVFA